MKKTLILAATLTLSTTVPEVADAQYRRNETVVITMKVDSWSPHEGTAGTLVTLAGTGFTRNTTVLVGGRPVRPEKMGARSISFRIPGNAGDGSIVLRKPGVANDYVVGNFNLWTDPLVSGFGPASGTYGTRVAIRGRHFTGSDVVMLGAQRLPVESWTENSLVVTIPSGAASGYFTVRNARNIESRSRTPFRVVEPAPYITDFSPVGGEPGSVVRIRGGNYGNDISVRYGRQPLPIRATGNGWVEVVIPANAQRSELLHIQSRRGNVRSSAPYDLALPPVLASYSPSWGTVGSTVTLSGRHFSANDRVTLDGQNCRIIELTEGRITVEVPPNARSGAFALHRGNRTVKASTSFAVEYRPVISNISAMAGAPGTTVTLTGQHLEGSRLYLGNLEIRPTRVAPGQWQFAIPDGAVTGNFRLVGRGGQAEWAKPFTVWNFPTIRRVSPVRGPVGSTVTLTGTELGNASQIFLGDVELPIVSRSGQGLITARIPRGAVSGPISWTAYGKNTPTTWNYEVLRAPVLGTYSPMEGAAGSLVTISGQGFDRETSVRYGGLPARVTQWSPGQITVEVPRNASRSDYFTVENAGGGATMGTPFGLLIAPTVRSWSARSGKPGMDLTIYGSSLAKDTTVLIGGQPAPVLSAAPDGGSVVVSIPEIAAGMHDVSVQYRGLRSIARKRFLVDAWAQVDAIRPGNARVGDTVMLSGSGLFPARIFYGKVELPVARRDRRGRQVWVTIPEGCSGKSQLTIWDGSHQEISSAWLQIDPPAPPAPTVRDHRNKDKTKKPGRRGGRDHRGGRKGY